MRVGEQRELHATAAGKLFLALSPPALLDAAYKVTGFKPQTTMTIISREDLQKGFAKIRKDGIAINRGESTLGAGAIAAPILDKEGRVLSAISTVFPLNIVDTQQWGKIEQQTQAASKKLSKRLMEAKF
jgi:DNA-binding IclR family transcriptional regulator